MLKWHCLVREFMITMTISTHASKLLNYLNLSVKHPNVF